MMRKRKQRHMLALTFAALLTLSTIGTAMGYGTQVATETQETVNEFRTGKYATELTEEFEAPDDWQPGVSVDKTVKVKNNGSVPVFACVKIYQNWVRRENVVDTAGNIVPPKQGEHIPNTFAAPCGEQQYAALIQWGGSVVLLASGQSIGTAVSLGLPTVERVEDADGKWLLLRETPDNNGELTFYYMGILREGEETPFLLTGVTMNPEIQASTLRVDTVWDKVEQKWITTTAENPTYDYQNAHYELRLTMNTVQATVNALNEVFDGTSGNEAVIARMAQFAVTGSAIDQSRDDSVNEKKLYLRKDGKLLYTPSVPEENWFMSHLSMLPGEKYADTLIIENQTSASRIFFLRAILKTDQDEIAQALLEQIAMKVYKGDSLLYDGTASGKAYGNNEESLQNMVCIGRYRAHESDQIQVELTLSKDTPLEYADLLAQIDWEFSVQRMAAFDPPETPDPDMDQSPQTGDTMDMAFYGTAMVLAFIGLALMYVTSRRRTSDTKIS